MDGLWLFTILAPLAAIATVALLVWCLRFRKAPAVQSLLWYLFLVTWLLVTNTLELLAPPGEQTIFFAKLEYLSFLYLPVAWISFALRYTGILRGVHVHLIVIAIIFPFLSWLVVYTNEYHGWVWSSVSFYSSAGLSVLQPTHGQAYWLMFTYVWGVTLAGTIIMVRSFFRGQVKYYRQSLWFLLGAVVPGISNIINPLGIIPGLEKDFTPLGYALSGICFLAAMYLHRMFWVMPVARSVFVADMSFSLLVLDNQGWIVDINKSFEKLFGVNTMTLGTNPDYIPKIKDFLDSTGMGGPQKPNAPSLVEGRYQLGQKVLEWTCQSVGRQSLARVFHLRDITAQAQVHDDMERLKGEFIRREKQATIGRIAAGLAHEINNPLAYVKSNIRALGIMVARENKDPSGEFESLVQTITMGLERIEHAVGSVLSFSRQDTDDHAMAPLDLQWVIETTIQFMHYESLANVRIIRHFEKLPLVMGNKNELSQVLFNILANAVQAITSRSKEAGFQGAITIQTGTSNSFVFCEISNNGPGIPQEHAQRIFDLFFTTKPAKLGTGLGLNLSRDIMEQRHGGHLDLVCLDPVTFRLEIPIPDTKGQTP